MNTSINNNHNEISGNPPTSWENKFSLNDWSNNLSLRVMSESDWEFWMSKGYVIINKAMYPSKVKQTAAFLSEFGEKIPNDSYI